MYPLKYISQALKHLKIHESVLKEFPKVNSTEKKKKNTVQIILFLQLTKQNFLYPSFFIHIHLVLLFTCFMDTNQWVLVNSHCATITIVQFLKYFHHLQIFLFALLQSSLFPSRVPGNVIYIVAFVLCFLSDSLALSSRLQWSDTIMVHCNPWSSGHKWSSPTSAS